ncbi:MAG: 1-acyl-sn-glycerol-3-phosphate acyltransferase [Acholeplasmataceae bacterium]|nr:1-acyl-sn-glycerol-3-phosphate acyltransferase [Acholeplasmataceae bacterium]
MFYSFLKVVLYVLAKIIFRLEISGTENIPQNGPVVIASNHLSLLDPPIIGVAATRKIHFMAKQELFVPVLGSIYRTLGAFPVRRGAADRNAIKYGIDLLLADKVLAIFPEGTRSKNGQLGKAEPGALMMAGKARAVIVPTAVSGTNWRSSGRIWPKVKVKFGKPIYFLEDESVTKEVIIRMTDELMNEIQALLDKN